MNYITPILIFLTGVVMACWNAKKADDLKGGGRDGEIWSHQQLIGKWMLGCTLLAVILAMLLSSCSPKNRPFKYSGDAAERNNKR